jgi:hypothetical protein
LTAFLAQGRIDRGETGVPNDEAEKDTIIAELEALKGRLDESLLGLAGKPEHTPMHEVVAGLLRRVVAQHNEILDLKRQLAESRRTLN